MLPVVVGVTETVRSILLYSLVLVALTVMFYVIPEVGLIFLTAALVLGSLFLYLAWRLFRYAGMRQARTLYLYSLAYLALIFGAVMVDSAVSL